MKKIQAILVILSFAIGLFAFPVRIVSWDIDSDLKSLNSMQISIDSVSRNQGKIIAYVRSEEEYQYLLGAGFDAQRLPNPAPELARELHSQQGKLPMTRENYYSMTQYADFMTNIAATYPQICSLENVGSSVQGRPLYFMKISQNASLELAKPEFRYISSIHGDEVVGYDLLIRLIQYLAENYGTDPRVTQIINSTEIWICPMLNPDGFVAGQRYNANGVDLNRNYPMPSGNQHPDGNAWAVENVAIMNFSQSRGFQLSANFHGGAQVINYPWDYTYVLTPDNDLIRAAALAYSMHNSVLYNSSEFPQGIVNGAQWYVITGSLQDWSYGFTDCIDLTAEIGNNKWPVYSQMPTYWNNNKESMLSLLEFVQKGVHGTVTSADGLAITQASISVMGNDKIMHVNPVWADYHRLLLPGDYTLTASAPGYISQTATINIPASGSVLYNFVLDSANLTSLNAQIRSVDGQGMPNLQVTLNTEPPINLTTDANGCFAINSILEGQYQLTIKQGNQEIYRKSFLLQNPNNRLVFIYSEPEIVFSDTFDTIANWVPTSPWGITNLQGNSVLADSPTGNYANNINKSCKLSVPINLSQIVNPMLTYKVMHTIESGYDFVYLEASTGGDAWLQLASYTGNQSTWKNESISLAQYSGQNLLLRFRIQTDGGVTKDGIFIDDFVVKGINASDQFFADPDGDMIVCGKDVQTVLDYAIGLDPLSQTFPAPWDADLTAICDVDQNGILDARDSFLIHKYISDPLYRFPVQGGSVYQYEDVTLSYENHDGIHQLRFEPADGLECLQLWLLNPDQVSDWSAQAVPQQTIGYISINPAHKKIAWVSKGPGLQGVDMSFQSSWGHITCLNLLNDQHGEISLITGSPAPDEELPGKAFALEQNSPNPFNPHTSISFYTSEPDIPVSLRIYNLKGQLVKSLFEGNLPAGQHTCTWDGKDNLGRQAGSSVYLYRLQSGRMIKTRKMVLSK